MWFSIFRLKPFDSRVYRRIDVRASPVAQHFLLRYSHRMPVPSVRKVEALRADFRSAAQLADMLGVNRAQITRWLRGAGIDPLNAERIDLLDLVWSALLRVYEREAALSWLFG